MDSNFNLNEWYGFKNEENKILRAKLVSTADKDGNFNVHKWKNNNELREDFIPYCIIQTHDRYTVIKIKEFDKAAKFVVDENLEIRMERKIQIFLVKNFILMIQFMYKIN